SSSRRLASASRKATVTMLTATAISVTTIISSSSVKPRAPWAERMRAGPGVSASLPGADVGVAAFAAGLAIGAIAENVHFTLHAGVRVLVGVAPGIGRQL